jgi:hypothetical protein
MPGIRQTDGKYNFNLAAELKPGAISMTPWGTGAFL